MLLELDQLNKKVQLNGIDQPAAELKQLTDRFLAIKVPGWTYCHEGGGTSYIPTEIQVWEILDVRKDSDRFTTFTANRVLTFPVQTPKMNK